ncbi:MAG: SMC-Scp complex subunit ScpB [Ferruginibacter sp.]|nr:SMC-Scp complex subunit ScpB [Ferruginibacter sp.]
MELSQIIPHIEALIFASDKPLINLELVELLNNALGFIEDRATIEQVNAAVEGIYEKYHSEFYAFELKQSGGGWQFLTKKEYHKTVAQLNGDKFLKRLSTAALETLAIIAYKQPIAKSEMEAIRGVNCDYAVQKLLEKDLVIIAGRNEDAVGKPLIYTTSKSFMDYFGINSTADLPTISEVLMEELVQATVVNSQPVKGEFITENSSKINEHNNFENIDVVEEEKDMELNAEAVLLIEEEMVIAESDETIPDENIEEEGISINDKQEDSTENKQVKKPEISVAEEDRQEYKKVE